MSEVRVDLSEQEPGAPSSDFGGSPSHEASRPDLRGLLPADHSPSADVSPSPSEASGLLSLPWEIIAHIASHLPAQCVINVLPKVCHALNNVAQDSTAWQIRARKVIGSKAGFPVGPREDFDWPTACMEMEQLVTCWTGDAHQVAKQMQEGEEERGPAMPQQRAQQHEEPAVGNDIEDQVEGMEMAEPQIAFGANERMEVVMEVEDGEMQLIPARDQEVRQRELEARQGGDAAALMEEERNHRMVFAVCDEPGAALNLREELVALRNQGNGRRVDVVPHQPPRSPSPPPALECVTLPSSHIAQVNSVLLLGGEGKVCATAARDWNVKLWDLEAEPCGKVLHELVGEGDFSTHRGWVWCLASRGPLLASGGFDSTVRLWDLEAGGAQRGLIKAGAAVLCLSCQEDMLLAGTFDKRVTMYDLRAADPLIKSLRLQVDAVMCLAADDKYIISGSKDCSVAVYDRRAGKTLKKLRLNSYLLSMSYSGTEVWTGDNSGSLHSFSMQAGSLKYLSQFNVGHTALVTGIHRSAGSLYTCSSDGTVKVHIPCAPPRTLCTLHHQAGVHGLSVQASVLAVALGNVSVEVWRPRQ